jgi:hypothetical protein
MPGLCLPNTVLHPVEKVMKRAARLTHRSKYGLMQHNNLSRTYHQHRVTIRLLASMKETRLVAGPGSHAAADGIPHSAPQRSMLNSEPPHLSGKTQNFSFFLHVISLLCKWE